MQQILIKYLLVIISLASINMLYCRVRRYTPKAPYAGLGKVSKANSLIKTKGTRGYFKPSNGYKWVNPYARSK